MTNVPHPWPSRFILPSSPSIPPSSPPYLLPPGSTPSILPGPGGTRGSEPGRLLRRAGDGAPHCRGCALHPAVRRAATQDEPGEEAGGSASHVAGGRKRKRGGVLKCKECLEVSLFQAQLQSCPASWKLQGAPVPSSTSCAASSASLALPAVVETSLSWRTSPDLRRLKSPQGRAWKVCASRISSQGL